MPGNLLGVKEMDVREISPGGSSLKEIVEFFRTINTNNMEKAKLQR